MEKATNLRTAFIGAVLSIICIVGMGFLQKYPLDGFSPEPNVPWGEMSTFEQINEFYAPPSKFKAKAALKFFAFDSAFVLAYILVYLGLFEICKSRSRMFATLGICFGFIAAILDAVDNAFMINYALGIINENINHPKIPLELIFFFNNLKWLAAFGTFFVFGLIWPKSKHWLNISVKATMLLFPLIGLFGIAFPSETLLELRPIFFIFGMIFLALSFKKEMSKPI